MVDVTEILQHWYAGRPKVEVARSLGVDAKTVRRYVAAAEAAGMAPGGPPVTEEQWRALARQWFPQLAGTGIRQVSWREIAVHHDRINAWVNAVAVGELEGRPVVVSGGGDRSVRVWDLASGAPAGDPFTFHGAAVSAVAVGELEGRAGGGLRRRRPLGAGVGPGVRGTGR